MRRDEECLHIVLCTNMGQLECVEHCRVSHLLCFCSWALCLLQIEISILRSMYHLCGLYRSVSASILLSGTRFAL